MKDTTLERLIELGIELTDGIRDCHIRDVRPEAQEAWAAQVIGAAELDPEVAAGGPTVLSDIATPAGEPDSAQDVIDMAFGEMDDAHLIEILEGIGAKALELAHAVRADGASAWTEFIREVPEPELFLRWGRAVQGDDLPSKPAAPVTEAERVEKALSGPPRFQTEPGAPEPQQETPPQPKPAKVTPLPRLPRRRRVNIDKRCAGTTKAGPRCRRRAIVGDKYCPQHGGKKPKAKPTAKAKS